MRQLRYLPKVMSETEQFLLRILGGFFIVSIIFLGARAYARIVVQVPKSGGEVVEALIGDPQYVNPLLASTNDVDRDLVRLMYSGLVKRNDLGEIVPDIAESIEKSADEKVFTVKMREGLTWSDGNPLTIDDVLFTFDLIQDPLYKSPLRTQFRNTKVERVDDRTLKFTQSQSPAAFLSNLTVGILPEHIWGDVPPPNFPLIEYNVKPVSYGPFTFDALKRDTSTGAVKEYRLVRNGQYQGSRPYLERLTFKMYPDPLSAADALRSKAVEGVSALSGDMRDELKEARVINLESAQYAAVFLNSKRGVLKNPEIRRALTQAINRNEIVDDALNRSAVVVDGMFADKLPGYAGKIQPDFSLDDARNTLETAGWKVPEGQSVRKRGNDELRISLTFVDQPQDQAVAEAIKKNWESIGFGVEIKPINPLRVPKDIIKPRDYDAFLYGEILSPDADLYPFWHSSQERDPGLNLSTFISKDGDKLLEDLRTTTNPQVIAEKRIAFQKLLAESNMVIFLYSPYYSYGLAKRVKGFDVKYLTTPADRFSNVEQWYVKTSISFKKR